VNSLPKNVTRQRRGCDLSPGPTVPESSTLTSYCGRSDLDQFVFSCYLHWHGRVKLYKRSIRESVDLIEGLNCWNML